MNFEKDTLHRYVGFHGAESKCHIRILDYEESKPIVVVCTQIPENKGTSVTNVAENLAQEIKQQLKEKNPSVVKELTQYVKETGFSKILGDAIKQVKRQESDGNLVFMLESVKLAFDYFHKNRETIKKIENLVWVEHYPAGLGYQDEKDHYSVVEFDAITFNPSWRHLEIEDIAKDTGYKVKDFEIIKTIV